MFLILQNDDNDKEGRISTNGEAGCTIHYTEKQNDVGEFWTLTSARTTGHTATTTDFSNMSEFHERSSRTFYRYLNVTISRQTHDKVQTTFILTCLSCLRSHWPTYACATAACHQSKQKRWLVNSTSGERFLVGKSLPKRSGAVQFGCHAEITKSALIGQEGYRAGSRREYRLVLMGLKTFWLLMIITWFASYWWLTFLAVDTADG